MHRHGGALEGRHQVHAPERREQPVHRTPRPDGGDKNLLCVSRDADRRRIHLGIRVGRDDAHDQPAAAGRQVPTQRIFRRTLRDEAAVSVFRGPRDARRRVRGEYAFSSVVRDHVVLKLRFTTIYSYCSCTRRICRLDSYKGGATEY